MIGIQHPPCDAGVIRSRPVPADHAVDRRKALAAAILGSSMAFIDGSVVNVALPVIQRDLAAGVAAMQWVVNAYMLCLGAFVLIGGSLGDRLGRRRVFIAGVVLFTAASVACGLADGVASLIAARAVQGFGAALLVPSSLAIIGSVFTDAERGHAIGIWAGAAALTTAIGPVLGGWLVDAVSWRAIFFLNLPLALATLWLVRRDVPDTRDPEAGGLDWLGAGLVAAGLAAIVEAMIAAPSRGFVDILVLAALGCGALLLIGFVAVEARSRTPMVPLQLFRSRQFVGTNVVTFLLYFALGGVLFFLPFDLIRAHGYSATAAGVELLPFSIIMGVLSGPAGRLADRYGTRWILAAGAAITTVGFALLGALNTEESYGADVFPGMVVLGLGMTLSVAPLTTAVMSAVDTRHAGVASGINNAVARIAGLLAVGVQGLAWPHGGEAASDAFTAAFQTVAAAGAVCALAAAICAALLIEGRPAA